MIELTATAQTSLNRYLDGIRTLLKGCQNLDSEEVERDVREHIESELAAVPQPVDVVRLSAVLDKLGSPMQWVPPEELPWWRRAIYFLRTGSNDFRFAYLSLGFFAIGVLSLGWLELSCLCFGLSFVTSRALFADTTPEMLGGQRWFAYPGLFAVYLAIGVTLLLWPIPLSIVAADSFYQYLKVNTEAGSDQRRQIEFAVFWIIPPATTLAWSATLLLIWRSPNAVANLLHPFRLPIERRSVLRIGLALLVVGLIFAGVATNFLLPMVR